MGRMAVAGAFAFCCLAARSVCCFFASCFRSSVLVLGLCFRQQTVQFARTCSLPMAMQARGFRRLVYTLVCAAFFKFCGRGFQFFGLQPLRASRCSRATSGHADRVVRCLLVRKRPGGAPV